MADPQLSQLTPDERAVRDAVERDGEGNLIPRVFHPDVAAYHEARGRVDSEYQEPTSEEVERHLEEKDRVESEPEQPRRSGKRK